MFFHIKLRSGWTWNSVSFFAAQNWLTLARIANSKYGLWRKRSSYYQGAVAWRSI